MQLAIAILLVSTLTTNGLFALWTATSRWHWFVRTAIALIGPALALAAAASEVAITLAGQACVVAAGVGYAARGRRQQRQGNATAWRFSLATFLLATLLATVGAAVVARFPTGNRLLFQSMSLVSVCSGLMILLGVWGASRFTWRDPVGVIGALALGGLLLSLPLAWFDWFALSFLDPTLGWPPEESPNAGLMRMFLDDNVERPVTAWFAAGPGTALATMLLTKFCVMAGVLNPLLEQTGVARTKWSRWLAGAALAAIAVATALPASLAWQRMAFPEPIPAVALPKPNGMEKIVAAGRLLEAEVTTNPNALFEELIDTRPKLEAVVRKSAPALNLLREGLAEATLVPPNYTDRDLTEKIELMMRSRDLGRALDATGNLAVLENRYDDAMNCYLDSVAFGMAVRNGGILIDVLPGMAVARKGVDGLRKIRRQLSIAQRSTAIEKLANLYVAMEWHGEFERRDRLWSQHSQGWHGRLDLALSDATGSQVFFDSKTYGANCLRERVQIALLIIELALLNHAELHGESPTSLSALELPKRKVVLEDPYADGREFPYKRRNDDYLLYSIGVDGVDDGGKPPVFEEDGEFDLETTGDLSLDASFKQSSP